jgi:hypothetical protein
MSPRSLPRGPLTVTLVVWLPLLALADPPVAVAFPPVAVEREELRDFERLLAEEDAEDFGDAVTVVRFVATGLAVRTEVFVEDAVSVFVGALITAAEPPAPPLPPAPPCPP